MSTTQRRHETQVNESHSDNGEIIILISSSFHKVHLTLHVQTKDCSGSTGVLHVTRIP